MKPLARDLCSMLGMTSVGQNQVRPRAGKAPPVMFKGHPGGAGSAANIVHVVLVRLMFIPFLHRLILLMGSASRHNIGRLGVRRPLRPGPRRALNRLPVQERVVRALAAISFHVFAARFVIHTRVSVLVQGVGLTLVVVAGSVESLRVSA